MNRLCAIALLCCSFARAQGIITTVAGGDYVYPTVPVPATSVPLTGSDRLAIDSAGNIYVSMFFDLVLRISADARLQRIAGNYFTGFSGDGGPATGASLNLPRGIAIDRNFNLFVADRENNRVRMISASGVITTVAGNGDEGFSGDGGPAAQASFADFENMIADAGGNLFIADSGNGRIRKITAAGIVTTVAGNGRADFSGDGGQATAASLNQPSDIFVDSAGNLFIADAQNNRVRKVTTDGVIRTVAGSGNYGSSGDGGQATAASLAYPTAVVADAAGNLYIHDSTIRIRKVATNGIITTFAG